MKSMHAYCAALLLAGAAAAEPVLVVTGLTPGWAELAGGGYASELMQAFAQHSGLALRFEALPLKRAIATYADGRAACFLGGDAASVADVMPLKVISSKVFRRAGVAIYTSAEQPAIHTLEQARRLRLGLERGFDYRSVLAELPNIAGDAAPAESQIRKMAIGRIDGYVGIFPPSLVYADQINFDPGLLLLNYGDTLHCHADPQNAPILDAFNLFLDDYRRSGHLRQIFNRYFSPQAWLTP